QSIGIVTASSTCRVGFGLVRNPAEHLTISSGRGSRTAAARPSVPASAARTDPTRSRGNNPDSVLLDVDLCASLFELRLGGVGLFPGDALLDGLRCRVDHVLGLLETEAGELADCLDDLDLVRADVCQHDVEFG